MQSSCLPEIAVSSKNKNISAKNEDNFFDCSRASVSTSLASFVNSQVIPGKEVKHNVLLAYSDAIIEKIAVTPGQPVLRGEIVLRLRRTVQDTSENRGIYRHAENPVPGLLLVRDTVYSPMDGIMHCDLSPNSSMIKDDLLFTVIELCGHSVQFGNLCALCGKSLSEGPDSRENARRAQISMVHDNMGVTVSEDVARNMDLETADRLRRERKLSLILDLDQTLVHASADSSVGSWIDSVTKENNNSSLVTDLYRFFLDSSNVEYYLRLRPGLRDFLRSVQDLYELHIYTMGSRLYANKVAAIIDQDGSIFKERVLSRDESGSQQRKSLQRLFPCDQSMVVVVDDRGDMWDWNDNLIRIHPYTYFIKCGDINAPKPDPAVQSSVLSTELRKIEIGEMHEKSKIPVKLEDNDKELRILMTKLAELHENFHNQKSRGDVREILPAMKAKVLCGCEILFLGADDQLKADAIALASSFGARCTNNLAESTSHVVSRAAFCHRVISAHGKGIPVVSYSWLFTSISYWAKQSEKNFLLQIPPTYQIQSSTGDLGPESEFQKEINQINTIKNRSKDKNAEENAPVHELDELDEELAVLEQNEEDFGGEQDSHVLCELEAELREWMGDSFEEFSSDRYGDSEKDDEQVEISEKNINSFEEGRSDALLQKSISLKVKRKIFQQSTEENKKIKYQEEIGNDDDKNYTCAILDYSSDTSENEEKRSLLSDDDEVFFDFREVLGSDLDTENEESEKND